MVASRCVVVRYDDHVGSCEVAGVIGLEVLGTHRASRSGQPETLLSVIGVLLTLDPDDHPAIQGRLHNIPQVVGNGLNAIESVDVAAATRVWSGLPEVLDFLVAVAVFAQASGVMLLILGRWFEPERVVPDELAVWRLVVIDAGEAHARLALFAAIRVRTRAVTTKEVGSTDAPLFQRPPHLFPVFADEAVDQRLVVLSLGDGEAGNVVVVGGAEGLVGAVGYLFYAFEAGQDMLEWVLITHLLAAPEARSYVS